MTCKVTEKGSQPWTTNSSEDPILVLCSPFSTLHGTSRHLRTNSRVYLLDVQWRYLLLPRNFFIFLRRYRLLTCSVTLHVILNVFILKIVNKRYFVSTSFSSLTQDSRMTQILIGPSIYHLPYLLFNSTLKNSITIVVTIGYVKWWQT